MKLKTLSMPTLHIHTKVEKGGVILSEKHQVGHSWVRNAYNVYNLMMLDSIPTTYLFTRDTGGGFRTLVINRPRTHAGYGYAMSALIMFLISYLSP